MTPSVKSAASEATTGPISANASGRPEAPETAPTIATAETVQERAWVEVDLGQLRRNFDLIHRDKPEGLAILSVIKDNAYGHGDAAVARVALDSGARYLAVSNIHEATHLRQQEILSPILIFGERSPDELETCAEHQFTCCINHLETAQALDQIGRAIGRPQPVHLKVDTGMGRYGVVWQDALPLIQRLQEFEWIRLEGVMTHFAMSDESDKTFANLQLERFQSVLQGMDQVGVQVKYRHTCNSGGFLDLPQAHLDMVRIGILPLGIYPSKVCRRIPGIQPVMQVKCRLTGLKNIQRGDNVGYGLRYQADTSRLIGVLPIGYGDGFPRLRNQGRVLIRGKSAPVVGANAMDATMVDLTHIPDAQLGDEVILVGSDGAEDISVHELANWNQTVSYDILCRWRARLPRVYRSPECIE